MTLISFIFKAHPIFTSLPTQLPEPSDMVSFLVPLPLSPPHSEKPNFSLRAALTAGGGRVNIFCRALIYKTMY